MSFLFFHTGDPLQQQPLKTLFSYALKWAESMPIENVLISPPPCSLQSHKHEEAAVAGLSESFPMSQNTNLGRL